MLDKINTIVNTLKEIPIGKYAIALAGSLAKETSDKNSDIDLYLYVDEIKSYEERVEIIKRIADTNKGIWVSPKIDVNPWGGEIDFSYQGIPVEITVRTLQKTNQYVNDSLEGRFEIIPATWTSNGYYTYIYLSELDFIKPLYDPFNILIDLKSKVKNYPISLKESIIKVFYRRANTWIDNFHYQSAIERLDILFTSPIVLHTLMDMIQVIFAINETYFPGDKKLQSALLKLDYCPKVLIDNLNFILKNEENKDFLLKQKELLTQVRDELKLKISR